jgi:hypothetical protein
LNSRKTIRERFPAADDRRHGPPPAAGLPRRDRTELQHAPGASSPRTVADVDVGRLRAAVVEGYNERYGEVARDFQILER